jgi:hypothetical protein
VTDAVIAAIDRPGRGGVHLIGDENLTWRELLGRLLRHLGRRKRVLTMPDGVARLAAAGIRLGHILKRRQSGLDPVAFIRLQTREAFFDPTPARAALGIGGGGLDAALADTVAACREAPAGRPA